MPTKSRTKRMGEWFITLFRSIGSALYPPNLKNSFRSVTKNWKEYICFYIAALVMTAGFWTVSLCTEANLHEARGTVAEEFDYHIEVALLDNEQYANLDQQLQYQLERDNEFVESYYWVNGGKALLDGTYTCRIVLDTTFGMENAYEEVYEDIICRVSTGRREIRFSPLYTFSEDYGTPYTAQLWAVSLLWLAFSILMMV